MIHNLKLKFFRKHEDLDITLAPGLNCLKGVNEKGKSSVIESILYALYGTQALRNSLADTVTWGHKESELKVSLTLEVSGRLYNFTRGKSGAECNYDGGVVTGQKEVSAFAAELLGADVNTANKLMLANQNNLRGALEDGPKAMSQQIETLADFDLFDRIFAAAEHKLLTGSPALMEDRVKTAQSEVQACTVTPLDVASLESSIAALQGDLAVMQAQVVHLQPKVAEAQRAFAEAEAQVTVRQNLAKSVEDGAKYEQVIEAQKVLADADAAKVVEPSAIETVKFLIAGAESHGARRAVHVEMTNLMKGYPEAYWEGSKEEFEENFADEEKTLEGYRADVQNRKSKIAGIDHQITHLQSQVITATTCPSCGSELKDKGKIETNNNHILARIDNLLETRTSCYASLAMYETALHNKVVDLGDLKKVRAAAQPYERFAATHGQHVEVSLDTYPPTFKWRGDVPEETNADIKALQEKLVSLQTQQGVAERGAARSVALAESLKEAQDITNRFRTLLDECPDAGNVESLKAAKWDVENTLWQISRAAEERTRQIAELQAQRSTLEQQHALAVARAAHAAEKLATAEADLAKLNFNNALLKKVRAARPLISDKLWGIVLSAVSSMFSTMRGVASVVTKAKDGFSVNGESVTSLSGSTLDILATAIRVALVKTFLPNTGFAIYDEPCASMDADRAAAMLGFLASAGFKQTLIVSHENAAEAVADNLIEL